MPDTPAKTRKPSKRLSPGLTAALKKVHERGGEIVRYARRFGDITGFWSVEDVVWKGGSRPEWLVSLVTVDALVSRGLLEVVETAGGDSARARLTEDGRAIAEARKITRGAVVRLYPTAAQARVMDMWRGRARSLWNLLLAFEQAAYSGENVRPELGWRAIWASVAELNHGLAQDRRTKRLAEGKEGGPAPVLPDLAKIRAKGLPEGEEPKLFIWENDLQKLMARLKQVPRTAWIGDLPSHAAQHVVKDLVKALQAMLRERGKRAAGTGGRDTGFPKFKKARYAAGSVYFANTQIALDRAARRVKFPRAVGSVRYDGLNGNIPADATLMGGRIWRQGEQWFLSTQWEFDAQPALPKTGREVGVKIAASATFTTFDGRGWNQFFVPKEDKFRARRYKLAGRKLARRLAAQRAREEKLARRDGVDRVRARRRSAGFYEVSARLARMEAQARNRRDDFLHKKTSWIVAAYDRITLQEMDVARLMMKEAPSKRTKRHERPDGKKGKPPRVLKVVRKINRNAAMARARTLLTYKAADAGRTLNTTHQLVAVAQECSRCGTLHPEMADGKPVMRCRAELPDGTVCGNHLDRHKNAAVNELKLGRAMRRASEVLDA